MRVAGLNRAVARDFQTLFSTGTCARLTDGQLLERYLDGREDSAFEEVVQRHGPMVWGVCRRVLHDHHDAEDAFQATFLVFVRKAPSIAPTEKVGHWLYGVAHRTAMKSRSTAARRRARETHMPEVPEPESPRVSGDQDLSSVLDQELRRLPEKYRIPIVLCDLQGKSHRQAGEQLDWPIGTVSGRLSRARSMLARRLTRRGVTLSGSSLALLFSQGSATAGVPPALLNATVKAASALAAGSVPAAVVRASANALMKGVLNSMMISKSTIAIAMVASVTLGAACIQPFGRGSRAEGASHPDRIISPRPLAGAAGARSDDPAKKRAESEDEIRSLEGTWAITDVAEEGIQATPEQRAKGLGRVIIKDGRLTVKVPHAPGAGTTFSMAVDPSTNPKHITLFLLDDKGEEVEHEAIRLGIYERKGDVLTLVAGADRPTGFEPRGTDSMSSRMVLKWVR